VNRPILLAALAAALAACDSPQDTKPKADAVKLKPTVASKASPPPPPPRAEARKLPKPDPNKALATKVKRKLEGTAKLDAHAIQVTATDGVVTLWGTVDTAPERKRAEEAAASVEGVQQVRSKLVVVAGS